MVIKTKYNIDDRVYIKYLKTWGRCLSIFISKAGRVEYNIRYFNNGDPKEIYFLEDELSGQEEENRVGFKE